MSDTSESPNDLIERFITAYNGIDKYLRQVLQKPDNIPFSQIMNDYLNWGNNDRILMRKYADLRNFLVHSPTQPYEYLSYPSLSAVQKIEAIRDRLTNPERVIPKFQKKVESINISDTLSSVLTIIRDRDFSQFPVYDNGKFVGLLTENGITRWLANHSAIVNKLNMIDFEEHNVSEVLGEEEKRNNVIFIARETSVDIAFSKFVKIAYLEAILITQTGESNQTPLGIITEFDVIRPE